MDDILLSVILPIYNVKEYLHSSIESILCSSSMDRVEILLIDDGSNDGSEDICEYYFKKYNSIRYFHKKNGGLSDARNYGLFIVK